MHDGPEKLSVLAPKAVNGVQIHLKHKQANYIPDTLEEAQALYKALPRKEAAIDQRPWRSGG